MRSFRRCWRTSRSRERGAIDGATTVWEAVERESAALEGRGRVLVRSSGTEPLVRVMVEAPTGEECREVCDRLVQTHHRRADLAPARSTLTRLLCAESSDMSGAVPVAICWSPGSRSSSTGATTPRGSRCSSDGHVDTVRAVGNLVESARRDRPRCRPAGVQRGPRGRRHTAGDHRPGAHPLGHSWSRHRGERPPARRLHGRHPHRPQRHRREPHRAPPRALRRRPRLQLRDRRRDRRAHDREALRRRSDRRGSERLRRASRPLRVRGHARRSPRRSRRRATGVPADRRGRRGGDLRRLRDPRVPGRDPRGPRHRRTARS